MTEPLDEDFCRGTDCKMERRSDHIDGADAQLSGAAFQRLETQGLLSKRQTPRI
jgi:hypothetical protein